MNLLAELNKRIVIIYLGFDLLPIVFFKIYLKEIYTVFYEEFLIVHMFNYFRCSYGIKAMFSWIFQIFNGNHFVGKEC